MSDEAAVAAAVPGQRAPVGYLSLSMLLLVAMGFLNYMDRFLLAILVEPIKRDLGLSDTQLGMLSGLAFALFYATMAFPIARLVDTGVRRRLLAIATAAWSAMTALCGVAQGFWQLFLFRVGVGAGEAAGMPAAYSLISDYFAPEKRAGALAVFTVGTVLGSMSALMLGGAIADLWGWRAAFLMLGLPGVLVAVAIARFLHEPARRGRAADAPAPPLGVTLRALLARPTFLHLIVGFAVMSFTTYGLMGWTPAFLIRSHGVTTAQAGLITGLINGVSGTLAILAGGFLADWLAARDLRWQLWLPCVTTLAAVPALFLYYSVPTLGFAVAAGFAGNFIASMYSGPILAAVQGVAGPHARGLATAILMFVTASLGLGLGPVLVGAISDHLAGTLGADSLRYALLGLLFFPLWGALHFWRAARTLHADFEKPT
jgi:predicted MFS family arabinose efflux permease